MGNQLIVWEIFPVGINDSPFTFTLDMRRAQNTSALPALQVQQGGERAAESARAPADRRGRGSQQRGCGRGAAGAPGGLGGEAGAHSTAARRSIPATPVGVCGQSR